MAAPRSHPAARPTETLMATASLPTRPSPATPETALPPSNAKGKAPKTHSRPGFRREQLSGWGMIAPAALLLLAFIFIPAILGFGLAFTNARLISPRPVEFVGTDNFARLFTDQDRKSTRLNSSHSQISYAVFCLKKKRRSPTP